MTNKFLTPKEQELAKRNAQWLKEYEVLKADNPDVTPRRIINSLAEEKGVSFATMYRVVKGIYYNY